jgi:hypothetical protein
MTIKPKTHQEIHEDVQNFGGDYNKTEYDYTFIFATQDTGEGVDRGDINWNQEVFGYLPYIEHPGKIVGGLSFTGPIDIRNFT